MGELQEVAVLHQSSTLDLALHPLQRTSNLVGLLQSNSREARASLFSDETTELGKLLTTIRQKLDKAESVVEILDRLQELATKVDQIQEALLVLGIAFPDRGLTNAAR